MPNVLTDLVIDRVDFVDEGSNSAAFIEIYKRKGQERPMDFSEILSKMKPEHSQVIQQELDAVKKQLATANEDLEKARNTITQRDTDLATANETIKKQNEELEKAKQCTCGGEADENGVCKSCGKVKKSTGFDETEILKSMPENLRAEFIKMRTQKEAAEEQVRKAAEEKREAEAVAKAAALKSLPVEQEKLVAILKNCDQSIVDILTTVASAIDTSVLTEVGKNKEGNVGSDAWAKIEAEADKVVARDSVTKQKAIATVIKEQPELYKEYLNGGTR